VKKRVFIIILCIVLAGTIYYFRYFFQSVFSVVLSRFTPPDLDYVRSEEWLYESGLKIGEGDFVSFEPGDKFFELKSDTIYLKGKPRALVLRTNKTFYEMTVSSLDGNVKGVYLNTEELGH
jgi:hypothetical protein